jgi:hypothetical protein
MRILTANLKHLYQRRGLWLVYAFLGFLSFAAIVAPLEHPEAGKGHYMGLVLLAFLIGFFAAALQREVLNKPVSYCLPGHRKVVRRFIFVIGVVTNALASLLFLKYPGLPSWQLVLVACSAFSAGLIFYWLGVALALGGRNSAAFIGFLPCVIAGGGFFGLHIAIELAVVGNPFGVVLAGVLGGVLAWLWLGSAGLARRYCSVPGIGFFDVWNRDKVQKYREARAAIKWDKLKTHPSPRVERFFLGRMKGCGQFSPRRYVWGGLYTTFGVEQSRWSGAFLSVLIALLAVCFLGYMRPRPGADILFFLAGIMVAHLRLPVYSSLLVSGGRNERFSAAMILVSMIAVLITTALTIMAVVSVPLAPIMPDITLRGSTFTFHAMHVELFFVPLIIIPTVFTIQLVFIKKPYFVMVTIMVLFMLLFAGTFSLESLAAIMNPVYLIVGLLVLSWSIFVLVLHYICMRRPLVGQTG